MFKKTATAQLIGVKSMNSQVRTSALNHFASFNNYRTQDNYIYALLRAISSRTNHNHDSWPSVELAGSPDILSRHLSSDGFIVEASEGNPEWGFATFLNKPVFIEHHNDDPSKARGVIVDSHLQVVSQKESKLDPYWGSDNVEPYHLPPTAINLLVEIDAFAYPKFARAVALGHIDSWSMGTYVAETECNICGNVATTPHEFCAHIGAKGAHHDFKTADGKRISKRSWEICRKLSFFEISGVFLPADETALSKEVRVAYRKSSAFIPDGKTIKESVILPDPKKDDPLREKNDEEVLQIAEKLVERYHILPDEAINIAQLAIDMHSPLEVNNDGSQSPVAVPPQIYDKPPHGFERLYLDWGKRPGFPNDPFMSSRKQAIMHDPTMPDPLRGRYDDLRNDIYQRLLEKGFDPEEALEKAEDSINKYFIGDNVGNEGATSDVGPYDPSTYTSSRTASTKVAENPMPQEFMIRAPNEIDTLREDRICPVCGSIVHGEVCPVCGDVLDPKGFDNPNLDRAEYIRQQMKNKEMQEAFSPPSAQSQGKDIRFQNRSGKKSAVHVNINNDMSWTPKVSQKTAARINKIEVPISIANPPQSNQPKNETVIADQTRPVTSALQTARSLIESTNRKKNQMKTDGPTPPSGTGPKTRVNLMDIGGVDEDSNESASKADAQTDLMDIGGTGASNVGPDSRQKLPTASPKSDDAGFNKDITTDSSGPTSTFGDYDGQEPGITNPVTRVPFPHDDEAVRKSHFAAQVYEMEKKIRKQANKYIKERDGKWVIIQKGTGKVLSTHDSKEKAEEAFRAMMWSKHRGKLSYDALPFPHPGEDDGGLAGGDPVYGVDPADPIGRKDTERVNVLEPATTPTNNSGPTVTWSGTDGNGVLRQQDPVTREPQRSDGVKVPDVKFHTQSKISLSALKLAELEIELGITPANEKYNRIASLDREDEGIIAAQYEMLSKVRQAGLKKLTAQHTAGILKLPKMANQQTVSNQSESPDLLDAGLFL